MEREREKERWREKEREKKEGERIDTWYDSNHKYNKLLIFRLKGDKNFTW